MSFGLVTKLRFALLWIALACCRRVLRIGGFEQRWNGALQHRKAQTRGLVDLRAKLPW